MERRAASGPSIVACYRELEPHPALRGRVRALFSFMPRSEASSQRRVLCIERSDENCKIWGLANNGSPSSSDDYDDGKTGMHNFTPRGSRPNVVFYRPKVN